MDGRFAADGFPAILTVPALSETLSAFSNQRQHERRQCSAAAASYFQFLLRRIAALAGRAAPASQKLLSPATTALLRSDPPDPLATPSQHTRTILGLGSGTSNIFLVSLLLIQSGSVY